MSDPRYYDVQVELLAFPYEVKERTVHIPAAEWDACTQDPTDLVHHTPTQKKLGLVFHYGQNDFQPSQTCYSVSVGDVIRLPDGRRFRVCSVGFQLITPETEKPQRPFIDWE